METCSRLGKLHVNAFYHVFLSAEKSEAPRAIGSSTLLWYASVSVLIPTFLAYIVLMLEVNNCRG